MKNDFITRSCAGFIALGAGLFTLAHAAWAIDPIKIGVVGGEAAPGSEWRMAQRRDGLAAALKVINDAKGALGRPFKLVFEERQGPADKAGDAVEKLITQDKVVAIIGGHESAAALASLEAAHEHKVPFVTDAPSHAIGGKLYPEAFNVGISGTEIATRIAEAMKALEVKRVVAFAENTDAGIEAANLLGRQLNASSTGVQYAFETLDPAAKDFTAVLQPYRSNPPDAIVQLVRSPGAYRLIDQFKQQEIAPSAKTWLYDATALIEDPAFWQNVNGPIDGTLVLGTYHPKMTMPDLGRKVAEAYRAKTEKEPGSQVFQAADTLFVIAAAIESGGSSEPEAITKALESLAWTGTRGKITFSTERADEKYHQWLNVPTVTYQITAAKQPIGETRLVQEPDKPFDPAQVARPK